MPEILNIVTSGFKSQTGVETVDSLLSRGGIVSMGGTIILLSLATALGGILETIGSLLVYFKYCNEESKNNRSINVGNFIKWCLVTMFCHRCPTFGYYRSC